jgi:hypothetical protein
VHRVDHFVLSLDDGIQDFLFLAIGDVEVVQGAGDLGPDLIELFGRDVKLLVGLSHRFARVLERSAATWHSQSVLMNFRPGSWPFSFHSFSAGFTLSFGFFTISSLKRSTTMERAFTPPILS